MKLPIVIFAWQTGEIRWESLKGNNRYSDPSLKPLILREPIYEGGETWLYTHLQKRSRMGIYLSWPICFHFWLMWRKQKTDSNGNWLPGTEQGIYTRTPGYRWDIEEGMKFTRGYGGLRWD